jgi:hypothetical protein
MQLRRSGTGHRAMAAERAGQHAIEPAADMQHRQVDAREIGLGRDAVPERARFGMREPIGVMAALAVARDFLGPGRDLARKRQTPRGGEQRLVRRDRRRRAAHARRRAGSPSP